jgi:energy-coupling factor transporter ATP-binding protein EcfA2
MLMAFKSFELQDLDLPPLVVITGPNGSGKTQLLDGLAQGVWVPPWEQKNGQIRRLDYGDLILSAQSQLPQESRITQIERFKQFVGTQVASPEGLRYPEPEERVRQALASSGWVSLQSAEKLEAASGAAIANWTQSQFDEFTPTDFGGDLFNVGLESIFSSYQQVRTMNRFQKWLDESEHTPAGGWLDEADFLATFGPPPWQLMNDVLTSIGLPYRFDEPTSSLALARAAVLRDCTTSREVPLAELSTGETALLKIALSIYSARHRSGVVSLPELVLLDEPDGALHPSMVRSLIRSSPFWWCIDFLVIPRLVRR